MHGPGAGPAALVDPAMEKEFDHAFSRAAQGISGTPDDIESKSWTSEFAGEHGDWSKEFASQEDWEKEFSSQEPAQLDSVDSADALAKTAGVLATIVNSSSNPKFRASKFLGMMEQLRDRQLAIEGDKMVQQVEPAVSFAQEFSRSQEQTNSFVSETVSPASSYAQEFMQKSDALLPSSADLAQEFLNAHAPQLSGTGSWEEDFMHNSSISGTRETFRPKNFIPAPMAPPRNWASDYNPDGREVLAAPVQNTAAETMSDKAWADEFEKVVGPTTVGSLERAAASNQESQLAAKEAVPIQQFSSDVSHDMDWSGEFQSRIGHLDKDSVLERSLYEADTRESLSWQQDFEQKLSMRSREEEWKEMEQAYETIHPVIADPRTSDYRFAAHNPFLNVPHPALSGPQFRTNLTESILALEATVQQDPQNASAWLELGKLQQENENELEAISALRRAIEIDHTNIEPYLSIAVSYTNENLTLQAQTALSDWLAHNPKYSSIPVQRSANATSTEVHESLIRAFLHAATLDGNDVDADVQTALGVLFNISNDYPKAIDCFHTAVSVRPQDFQLWNKLGATLANSGQGEKAMEAYFNALQINPAYIRVRYNLAIACMQMGQYQEAAGYLLTALAIQEQSMNHVLQKSTPELMPEMRQMHVGQSESVWGGLRLLLSTYSKPTLGI
ncbi:Peroxisomal membrane signal receptor PTS1 [Kappamyces sp. JEL0680]|nr:Peroxisomal membrane signal receptor PTS1 [Kappamyces sp. JEL0680]